MYDFFQKFIYEYVRRPEIRRAETTPLKVYAVYLTYLYSWALDDGKGTKLGRLFTPEQISAVGEVKKNLGQGAITQCKALLEDMRKTPHKYPREAYEIVERRLKEYERMQRELEQALARHLR